LQVDAIAARRIMTEHKYCPLCGEALKEAEIGGRRRKVCPSTTCEYVHWDNPTPVVAAIVELDGSLVLVRNRGWPAKMFGLVTGFLERGESPEDGVQREVREELGLECDGAELVGVYAFEAMHQVILAYHVPARGPIELGDELEEHKRVPIDRLKPWPFGTGHAVRDWLARRGSKDA